MKTRGGWSGCLRFLARLPEERVWLDFSLASAIAIAQSPLSNSGIERRARGPVFLSRISFDQGASISRRERHRTKDRPRNCETFPHRSDRRQLAIEEQRMGSRWTKMSRTLFQKKNISKEKK